jgi:predicted alpha/beta hydrolase
MDDTLLIPAVDGFRLSATRYEPAAAPRGWVVVANAMGVKQAYYRGLARWLAEKGWAVVTFDYRGVGASRPAPPGPVSLFDWAQKDLEGVLQWARGHGRPVVFLGHSLGTQLLGLAPSAVSLHAVIGVGSQTGDYRRWPFPSNVGMFVLATVLLPAITAVFGKLPRGWMGEEVPKGPVDDWARWIRSSGYMLSEGPSVAEAYARLACPMTGFSFSDDGYAPRSLVDDLFAIYQGARVERVHLTPQQLGVKKVGHFGAFRPEVKDTLWPQLLERLEAVVTPLRQAS